jgi:hypothetical protein
MNSRQLILTLIIAVVLGAIGWILFHRGARSWESQPTSGGAKVIEFPLNDVAHLTIKNGTSELNLVRKEDGWVVRERADYPANFAQVSRLLQKVWNLKPVQTLQVGPSQLGRFDLLEPANGAKSGTLLELKNKDEKRITALLVGKQYLKKSNQSFAPAGFPAGRYVMPEDGSKRVGLVSDPLQDLVTEPERWLNREFIKIEKPRTIALDGATPTMKWKLERENGSAEWKFADAKPGEELDQTKASASANSISNLSFTDVLDPQTRPETNGLDHPSTAMIQTFDGFTYTLKIGKQSGETYPALCSIEATLPARGSPAPNENPEEQKKLDEEFAKKKTTLGEKLAKEKKFEGRPFLINKSTVAQLLKNRADLVKAEPSPTPSPASIDAAPHEARDKPSPANSSARSSPNKQPADKAPHTPARPDRP